MIARILHDEPDLGGLTGTLRDVAARCLAKDPAERPSASALLGVLLGEADAGGPVPAAGPEAAAAQGAAYAATLGADAWGGGAGGMGGGAPSGPSGTHGTWANTPHPAPMPVPPAPPAPTGQPPARRTSGIVAVCAAVVAVVAAAVVTVVALNGRGSSGGAAAPSASPSRSGAGPASKPANSERPSHSPTREASETPAPPSGFPVSHAGRWTGRLRQSDGKAITVVLDLPAGGRQGRISYPDEGCGGVETFVGNAGGTVTVRERITERPDKCVDTGTVTLVRHGGALQFSYTGTEGGRTWAVAGPMRRAG
ncbi:hypothetical protein GEV43_03970 [Actinomadura sp. J1-007]|uniref:hypothetical protein n=1 Tax=Actinomadura sp. J1-007 TaxID=2661913 RepID=UPI00132C456B|nr:hypothetical protein [Actinomadura sp. J1-007]MWK33281.1 hypothetical protein [Actinomadura sp. J1-007]